MGAFFIAQVREDERYALAGRFFIAVDDDLAAGGRRVVQEFAVCECGVRRDPLMWCVWGRRRVHGDKSLLKELPEFQRLAISTLWFSSTLHKPPGVSRACLIALVFLHPFPERVLAQLLVFVVVIHKAQLIAFDYAGEGGSAVFRNFAQVNPDVLVEQ